MRLLLDEMYSIQVARELRDRHGHDVICVRERTSLTGATDRRVLDAARADGRALVTEDLAGFMTLDRELRGLGGDHHGIVLAPARRFPRAGRGVGAFVRALHAFLEDHPGDGPLPARIHWLTP